MALGIAFVAFVACGGEATDADDLPDASTGGAGLGGSAGGGGASVGGSSGSGAVAAASGVAGAGGSGASGTGGSAASGETCTAPSCVPVNCFSVEPFECGDCQNNDGDGLADLADPDCLGACDDSETSLGFAKDPFDPAPKRWPLKIRSARTTAGL